MMRLANTAFGSALLVPINEDPILLCNTDEAMDATDDSSIEVYDIGYGSLKNKVTNYANGFLKGKSKIGMNTSVLNYKAHEHYEKYLNGELINVEKTILPDVFFGLYQDEIEFQRKVSELADIAIKTIEESLVPGRKECEIAAEAAYAMMKAGAESLKFHTVVSSGRRSAYIHSWPGEKEIKNGDLVLVDLGPIKAGYTADISRTFLVGKDPKKEKLLRVVDESVGFVLSRIEPGVSCRELDALSRKVIKTHGYPDYPTGLGHCLSGFLVPTLSKNSKDIERVGSLHTIEPGIYVRDYGGARIEENVVVTKDGYELLTKSPRLFL
jgi:Xaa-Pro aminopeptidase